MSAAVPPPPTNAPPGSFAWADWYYKLTRYVSTAGSVPWSIVNKTGADITDIPNRSHNHLQTLQGGTANEFYHMTSAEHATLAGLVGGSVASIIGLTGAVTLANLVAGGVAPKANPTFTGSVGFNGSAAITKPTVTGSRGGNAALASLLTALATYGLITDSTTV